MDLEKNPVLFLLQSTDEIMRTHLLCAVMVGFLVSGCSYKPPVKMKTGKIEAQPFSAPLLWPAPSDPARAALERIREQYRAEFEDMTFPKPGKSPSLSATKCKGFPKTLEAIGAFERKYGVDSPETAHLVVLRGMIHLQSERFLSASSLEPEMLKAVARFPNSSHSSADRLLTRNFNFLVTGWREIHKHQQNLKAQQAGKPFPFRSVDFRKVQQAADRIRENLRHQSAKEPEILRDPESDLHGLYVAAVTATFYTWVQNRMGSEKKPERTLFYEQGRDLIGLFLTEKEKNLKIVRRTSNPDSSSHHQRYLSWYSWLSTRCKEKGQVLSSG